MPSTSVPPTASRPARRTRLHAADEYSPWVRAEELKDIYLFYAPVTSLPFREQEKLWYMRFYEKLEAALETSGLQAETFLRYKDVERFGETFQRYALKCQLRIGVGRTPGKELPRVPTQEEVQAYVEDPGSFDYRNWIAEYLYWFVTREPDTQRTLFSGHGQLLTLFLPANPAKPPQFPQLTPALREALPVFRTMNVDGLVRGTFAGTHPFQQTSKQMFGEGLEDRPDYPGIRFVLPLLDSGDFFAASPELREQWFKLFDIYIRESARDRGVLLAFQKEEYADVMVEVLDSMRAEGLVLLGAAR